MLMIVINKLIISSLNDEFTPFLSSFTVRIGIDKNDEKDKTALPIIMTIWINTHIFPSNIFTS